YHTISHPLSLSFFFYCSAPPPDLHSFPTRRSSDLPVSSSMIGLSNSGSKTRTDSEKLPALNRLTPSALATCGNPRAKALGVKRRSEEHTSELQSPYDLVCRLLLEKKKKKEKKEKKK